VAATVPAARNAWAPAMYYEPDKKDWLVLWPSAVLADGQTGGALDNRIYATATKEFRHFTAARLFFDPGYAVSGATLVPVSGKEGQYYLLFTDERSAPPANRIDPPRDLPTMAGYWRPFTESGARPLPLSLYPAATFYTTTMTALRGTRRGLLSESPALSDATSSISLREGMRHGSLLHLETSEYSLCLTTIRYSILD